MPYKDIEKKRKYQKDWVRQKRNNVSNPNVTLSNPNDLNMSNPVEPNKKETLEMLRKLINNPKAELSGSFHPYPKPGSKKK